MIKRLELIQSDEYWQETLENMLLAGSDNKEIIDKILEIKNEMLNLQEDYLKKAHAFFRD